MWALPRMEEVPILTCSLHPKKEKDEEDIARALTPTKNIPMGSGCAQNPEGLVLPGNKLLTCGFIIFTLFYRTILFEHKPNINRFFQ